MQTTNIVDENIKRIGELFPNCLTERFVRRTLLAFIPMRNSRLCCMMLSVESL